MRVQKAAASPSLFSPSQAPDESLNPESKVSVGAGECGAGEPGRVKGETPGERLRNSEWAKLAQQVMKHMPPNMIDARNHKCMTALMAAAAHGFRRETYLRTH